MHLQVHLLDPSYTCNLCVACLHPPLSLSNRQLVQSSSRHIPLTTNDPLTTFYNGCRCCYPRALLLLRRNGPLDLCTFRPNFCVANLTLTT